jgi:hypothetical protein
MRTKAVLPAPDAAHYYIIFSNEEGTIHFS